MSNRTLIYIFIVVLIVAASGFAVWRGLQSRQSQKPFGYQAPEKSSKPAAPAPFEDNQRAESAPAPAVQTLNGCERKFNETVLKTAKVEIKNRRAELSVKDFGKIVVEFFDQDAPKTVENFLRLTNSGYFDCLTFHRVAKGFVIQGGDPTGTGAGGDSAFGGEFADEINALSELYKTGYKKGYLAMANRGPNTNTSQFFIMLADVQLPPNYTIFGRVVSGVEVVEKIGQVEITPQLGPTDGKPKTPVVMETVRIVK